MPLRESWRAFGPQRPETRTREGRKLYYFPARTRGNIRLAGAFEAGGIKKRRKRFKNLGVRDRMGGAVAASLGLTAFMLMNINTEVIMSASIALTGHLYITAVCLVAGIGLLGRPVSSQDEGRLTSLFVLF